MDPSGGATFEQISTESNWIAQAETPFHGTGEPTTVWARFEPPKVSSIQHLLIHAPLWERSDLYVVRDGILVESSCRAFGGSRSSRFSYLGSGISIDGSRTKILKSA